MDRLFWGLFFVLLNIEVSVGTAVFDILPDFIGFWLLMKGMESLAEQSRYFDRGRHLSFALAIASVIVYGWKLMAPTGMTGVWLWVTELAVLILTLLLVRWVVMGVRYGKENTRQERLMGMWLILAVILPICHLVNWVPLVGGICSAAAMVTALLFLAAYLNTKKKSAE